MDWRASLPLTLVRDSLSRGLHLGDGGVLGDATETELKADRSLMDTEQLAEDEIRDLARTGTHER